MTGTERWRVDITIDDDHGAIHAHTRLHGRDGATLDGDGVGSGDTLAVARALTALTGRLYAATPGAAPVPSRRVRPRGRLAEIAGYLGGGLLLGGAALLVGNSWADLSRPARIALLAAVSVTLPAAGLLARGRADRAGEARRRLAAVLLALGAVTSALTAGTVTATNDEFWAGATGLAVAVPGYLAVRSVAGALTAAALSAVTFGALAGEVLDAGAVVTGVVLVAVGLAWAGLAAVDAVPRHPLFAVAAVIAFVGAQQPLGETGQEAWAYCLSFGVAVLWLAGYLWQRSPVLLVAGVSGIAVAVPEAIWDWTDGAVGGAVSALVAGAVLLTASALGFRLARRDVNTTNESRGGQFGEHRQDVRGG